MDEKSLKTVTKYENMMFEILYNIISKTFKQHKHTVYVVFNLSEMDVRNMNLKEIFVG